jgi:flagellin
MVINSNLEALSSTDNLNASQSRLARSLARISSGSKLPFDDAAGLSVGTKMDAQVHRINGAKSNVANATSFVQTQDGYLTKIGKALDRMSELAILAQDATKSDNDRSLYNKEFGELQNYISTNANKEFNGVSLFSPASLDVTIDSEGGSFAMAGINVATAPYSTISSPAARATMQLSELTIAGGTITLDSIAKSTTPISALGMAAGTLTLGGGGPTVTIGASDTLQQVFDNITAADPTLTAAIDGTTGMVTLTSTNGSAIAISQTGTDFLQKTNLASSGALTVGANSTATSTAKVTLSTPAAAVVAISPNDTLQQVFDRIHAADPSVTASLNEATGLVTLTSASGSAMALSQTGTDFLQKTNLAASGALTLGANGYAISTANLTPAGLGIGTVASAKATLDVVKLALTQLGSDRATLGSYMSRLSYSAEQLTISKQNLTGASSRIQDVDVADESTEYARANIKVQSGTAMLAQANQLPQQVLRLLQ